MLIRFCLYGFLKNQRYFEPFFMLALLAHELSFFGVGVLIACRSLTLNLLEIPSGALADSWGRRRCMIASFVAYVVSFLTFAWAPSVWYLIPAMVLYGIGDSFRTGTHKAMIFEWLRLQGRESERTRVYGLTRSWSKYGSAVSALLSAVCVLLSGDFRSVFLFATIPYVLNIINFWGYPPELDGRPTLNSSEPDSRPRQVFGGLRGALSVAWRTKSLRQLVAESMAWEGVFNAVHDYLQPALLVLILGWLATAGGESASLATDSGGLISPAAAANSPATVIIISATYALLSLLSGYASRSAHQLSTWAGSDDRAATILWKINLGLFAGLAISDLVDIRLAVVAAFVALGILQNVWRPILISRFDEHSDPAWGATILSIESQSQRLATLAIAPLVGYCVDLVVKQQGIGHFWPIGVVGVCAGLPMLMRGRKPTPQSADNR